MRLGNLFEMEDLRFLFVLLRCVGIIDDFIDLILKDVVVFIEMVIKYVVDGSGIYDMIEIVISCLKFVVGLW